ncbi:hypothetical protein RIR_jg23043.t1 [Rhizophagus irregularis DAOM 181602=DAOM 197198]|nr:hypothetical protein RIR_jg23043.t1 [Rhizophagus irregularis DAOM 181602=DAOM 197198]CAG8664238.1 2126_t:CDS:2 [Rhizophagus irregularis]
MDEMDNDGMELPKRNYNFLTKKLSMTLCKVHLENPKNNNQNIDSENKVVSENDEYEVINFASPNFNDKPKYLI